MPTQGCHGTIIFSAFGQKKKEAKKEKIWRRKIFETWGRIFIKKIFIFLKIQNIHSKKKFIFSKRAVSPRAIPKLYICNFQLAVQL